MAWLQAALSAAMDVMTVLAAPPADCGGLSDGSGDVNGCYRALPAIGIAAVGAIAALATVGYAVVSALLPQILTMVPPDLGGTSPTPPPDVATIARNLPVRTSSTDRTTGVFRGEKIVSGEDPASIADLRPFPHGGWPTSVISHVESHVAARMRAAKLRDGVVVLNNIPCGNRGFDKDFIYTCERHLRSLLPSDARLAVWATPDGGLTWWTRTYVGTGERIRE